MTPADIKALRKSLRCTPGELAETLGLDRKVIMAWEAEEMFPTRQWIDKLEALREDGPGAVVRRRRRVGPDSPWAALSDPEVWRLVRKLLAHRELRAEVAKLAEAYDDPE